MLLFSGELVRFLGADEELRGPAEAYLRGLMFFGPMIPCGLALSYFVRVNGKPALASVGLMLSALINIVLDAVFIPVFGMGVEGAAYATGIAYTITTGVLCLHFFTPEAKCRFTRAIGAWKEVGAGLLERRFRIDQRDVDRTGDLVHQLDFACPDRLIRCGCVYYHQLCRMVWGPPCPTPSVTPCLLW